MPIALALLIALAAPPASPLPPGRYAGLASAGAVDLTLLDDGRAIFGGAALRWRAEGESIVLRAPGGAERRLRVEHDDRGAAVHDDALGAIRLTPLPSIEPVRPPAPVRPLAWVGGWRHRASGGALVLRLRGDGRYEMQQPGAEPDTGGWHAIDEVLVLTPDGGSPLSYRARIEAGELVVTGGDLPVEVRFAPDTPR